MYKNSQTNTTSGKMIWWVILTLRHLNTPRSVIIINGSTEPASYAQESCVNPRFDFHWDESLVVKTIWLKFLALPPSLSPWMELCTTFKSVNSSHEYMKNGRVEKWIGLYTHVTHWVSQLPSILLHLFLISASSRDMPKLFSSILTHWLSLRLVLSSLRST